jgi:hypothetical protein
MGGSNQMIFLITALFVGQGDILGQGSAAVPLLIAGVLLGWAAAPAWTELVLMWPNRGGGISAACAEAFRPYNPVLSALTGTCYWWGWIPTCGLTALLSASALQQWYFPHLPVEAVEITEGVLINDPSRALSILRRLKLLGVKIAMDDFGTGFASLSSLQSFPFDKIKIDRTFVMGVDHNGQSQAIVRAVIGLGKALNIPVIAEGVETEAERLFLIREGCAEIQRYVIGYPCPIESYAELTSGRLGGERAMVVDRGTRRRPTLTA